MSNFYIGEDTSDTFCGVEHVDLCIFEATDNIFYFTFKDENGDDKDVSDYTAEGRIITTNGEIKSFTLTHVVDENYKMRLTVPYTTDFTDTEGGWFINLVGPLTGDSKIVRKVIGNVVIIEENLGIEAAQYLLYAADGLVLGTADNTPIEVVV